MSTVLDVLDTQGLLVSAFAHLPCAAYRMLRIDDGLRARLWLQNHLAAVTLADKKDDLRSLNIAVTSGGLQALGLEEDGLNTFPPAFLDGMASERRSRILGDSGLNHPLTWTWGNNAHPVHVLLLMYGSNEAELERELRERRPDAGSGLQEVATLTAGRPVDSREHFGFADGVGQPVVKGSGRKKRQEDRTGHATELPTGEFILGFPNVYKKTARGATVRATADPQGRLLPAPGDTTRHDLGRNGSYLVFRQLYQDVPGFWRFVTDGAQVLWPGDPEGPTRLASKFVGRWPSGAPLVLHPDQDPFGGVPQRKPENDFTYGVGDPHGAACPFGAHIRRANPRDMGKDPKQARISANRHRLLRRGRAYGPRIADPLKDDGVDRGLHFICLNADLERQFEFVQQTWINNPVFAGLYQEVDPLLGAQEGGSAPFTIPHDPVRLRVPGLQRFVSVRGGAYFFLPGIRALRFLCGR